jgi:hypothetical protein
MGGLMTVFIYHMERSFYYYKVTTRSFHSELLDNHSKEEEKIYHVAQLSQLKSVYYSAYSCGE